MTHRTPRPAEIRAAAKILEKPAPDASWRWQGACLDVPLDALPQDEPDQALRTVRARAFVSNFCGNCTVRGECIRDAFDTYTEAPDGVVLGGYTPGEAKMLWHAANGVRAHETAEAAVAHYGHLEKEATKRAAERAAARQAAAVTAPASAQEIVPSPVILPTESIAPAASHAA